ncbi:MAG: hypothetical protein AMXMBFR53_13620 [Gemmatimonadota bacterium]
MSIVAVALAWRRSDTVEVGDAWLTPEERSVLKGLKMAKRAADWRVGRWVAKEAVLRAVGDEGLQRSAVEVLPQPEGRPEARILASGKWPDTTLSLSHSGDVGFAAAALGTFRLGCDVQEIAPRSEDFIGDYFTPEETAWIREDPGRKHLRANLVWSAKESALKALGEGLRLDTRSVAVTVEPAQEPYGWGTLRARATTGDRFSGCWRASEGYVWTVVADAAIALVLTGGAG